jgi:hypothetical protein
MACTGPSKGEVGDKNDGICEEGGMSSMLESSPEASGACHRCAEVEEEEGRNLIALALAMKGEEDAEHVD